MPFSPISANSKVFNQSGDGRYVLSTLTFGQPSNYITVKGGTLNKTKTAVTATVNRYLEKDVLVNGVTTRRTASIQLVLTIPPVGYTSTEIDALLADIDSFVTVPVLDRILSGES